MERWGFLFSVVSSPIMYVLKTTRTGIVCPNINPIMLSRTFVTSTMRRAIRTIFKEPVGKGLITC